MKWTTRLPHEITRRYPSVPRHAAMFWSKVRPDYGPGVILSVPDCILECYALLGPGTVPSTFIDRPPPFDLSYWLDLACKIAWHQCAAIVIFCDTSKRTEVVAKAAAHMLPNHERVDLGRAYAGKAGIRISVN